MEEKVNGVETVEEETTQTAQETVTEQETAEAAATTAEEEVAEPAAEEAAPAEETAEEKTEAVTAEQETPEAAPAEEAVEEAVPQEEAAEETAETTADNTQNDGEGKSYSEKQREKFEKSKEQKRALIEEARALADSNKWKETAEKQKELMERWKKSGYAAEENESLWQEFLAVRNLFFDNRKKHFEEMDEKRKEAAEKKRALIERVRSMEFSAESHQKDTEILDEIFELWKQAGFADKEINDALWEEFNQAREPFFVIRNELRKQQDEEFRLKRERKQALIDETKKILESADTGKDNTERIKELSKQWKEIGFSGKKNSEELWNEFKAAQDDFWTKKKEQMARRNEEGIEKLKGAITRRQQRIAKIKENTDDLTGRMMQPQNSEKAGQFLTWINENHEQIEAIKAEIAELNAKIDKIKASGEAK